MSKSALASLSLSEKEIIHVPAIEVPCYSSVLSFHRKKGGKMNKSVELRLGVIFVSFIDILLFIVNTNTSAKRKRAKKCSLPGPWEKPSIVRSTSCTLCVTSLTAIFCSYSCLLKSILIAAIKVFYVKQTTKQIIYYFVPSYTMASSHNL